MENKSNAKPFQSGKCQIKGENERNEFHDPKIVSERENKRDPIPAGPLAV